MAMGWHKGWVACTVVIVAVMALLAPWLFDRELAIVSPTQLGTDFITKQWPNATFVVRAVQQWGEIPLWRIAAMGGVPIIGNPSMLLLYPPYWLVFLFPIGWAFTLYFALHLVWAGWGVYGLARQVLRLSSGAALLAALAFALSAKMVAHLGGGHIDIVAAVAWLPWLWWAVDRLARQPDWLSLVGAAVSAAAQVLTHLPTLWLSAWVVGGWWLYVRVADRGPEALRRWWRCAFAGLGASVLALGLAAAQLCPMVELLPFATRSTMTLAEASRYALPVPLLIGLIFPMALAFPEWVIYPGVVTLALVPASGLARRSVRGWSFLLALAIVGTVFSLGQATPLYTGLFRVLPGMTWLRVPARAMFLVQLALALLAGVGWDGVREKPSPALVSWWVLLVLLAAVGTAWAEWFPGVVMMSIGSLVVVVGMVAVLMMRLRVRLSRRYALAALATLAVCEAVALSPQLIARDRVDDLTAPMPVGRFLAGQDGQFRVYSSHGLISLAQAVANGLETVDGNDPFQLGYYVRWANVAGGCDLEVYSVSVPACATDEVDPGAYLRALPEPVLLGVANVRYVVADHDLPHWASPIWQDGAVRVYENPAVLPRAFVVPTIEIEADDSSALALLRARGPAVVAVLADAPSRAPSAGGVYRPARVVHWAPNRIEVHADGPGWLVVSQVWAPGWRAYVDGVRTEMYRTNVAFCGLALPAGSHVVMLEYAPTGWVWGRWVSLVTVFGVVAGSPVALWGHRRDRRMGRVSQDVVFGL